MNLQAQPFNNNSVDVWNLVKVVVSITDVDCEGWVCHRWCQRLDQPHTLDTAITITRSTSDQLLFFWWFHLRHHQHGTVQRSVFNENLVSSNNCNSWSFMMMNKITLFNQLAQINQWFCLMLFPSPLVKRKELLDCDYSLVYPVTSLFSFVPMLQQTRVNKASSSADLAARCISCHETPSVHWASKAFDHCEWIITMFRRKSPIRILMNDLQLPISESSVTYVLSFEHPIDYLISHLLQ